MLEELKKQVCDANRALERHGLVTLTWGNVSGLDRDSGLMVIKPSGVAYADLDPADLPVVDPDGNVVEGRLNPSSDTPTHVILYKAFPEICGITHTHSPFATMFAQARRPIPCLGTTHADRFHGEVPVTRPLTQEEVGGDYEDATGQVIVERFRDLDPMRVPAVLVAQHGPFTWGRDAMDSLRNNIALESVAEMALGVWRLNGKMDPIPAHLLDKHFLRKHGPKAYYGQNE